MVFNEALAGRPAYATIDHIVSSKQGGTDHPSNLRLAHYICNNFKSTYENEESFSRKALNGHIRIIRMIRQKKI